MRALLLALVAASLLTSGCKPQEPGKPSSTIQEDDPRWDCRIHGNRQCGPPNVKA